MVSVGYFKPPTHPEGGVAMRALKGGGCCQVNDEALHLGAIGRGYHDYWAKW